jgi:endonuclease/exonuclease/phosphatase family metal-dependent hydrolase
LADSPWLQKKYSEEISREPFFATFASGSDSFTVVNFHATTKDKYPETEIKYFKYFLQEYPDLNLIFCGDFNTSHLNSVFNPLKAAGFKPVLQNQKTTLSHFCYNGDCLASEYDNVFFDTLKINMQVSGVIHFYKNFPSRKAAEKISDHLPVYCRFSFRRNSDYE